MNCSLFVVFHSRLHEEQYLDREDAFAYAKVGDAPMQVSSPKILQGVIQPRSMPVFTDKGKHWAESEFLISMYNSLKKDPNYNSGSEWIGFMQYDHACKSTTGEDLLNFLQENLDKVDGSTAISFVPINLQNEVYYNHIAMDFSDPQKLQGDPLCYFPMISDYNKFYGTNHTYMEFRKNNESIALCSAFVMTTKNFMKMMEFCIWAADKNNLDQFDPARKHRLAGGLMERYYGCWMALSGVKLIEFPLMALEKV
jgi:hypothetical protein